MTILIFSCAVVAKTNFTLCKSKAAVGAKFFTEGRKNAAPVKKLNHLNLANFSYNYIGYK